PDGQVFTYGYDGLNRLAGVYQDAGTGTWLDLFTYTPQGLLAARAERYASEVAYGYDPIGRPIALTSSFYGGAGTVTLGFGLNPAGQITSVARDNDAYAWTGHYNVNRGYTANGLNQYSAVASSTAAGFHADHQGSIVALRCQFT
ncbi:MAG TPA: hypothetical protein VK614_03820, partial [Allosphingosinicella sp.]|nr:hypothetical protein [Allosphingosinicella sp.]